MLHLTKSHHQIKHGHGSLLLSTMYNTPCTDKLLPLCGEYLQEMPRLAITTSMCITLCDQHSLILHGDGRCCRRRLAELLYCIVHLLHTMWSICAFTRWCEVLIMVVGCNELGYFILDVWALLELHSLKQVERIPAQTCLAPCWCQNNFQGSVSCCRTPNFIEDGDKYLTNICTAR